MRVGAVPVALAGLVVAFVPTGGQDARPLPLSTQRADTPRLAFVWTKRDGVRLARLDARALRTQKTPTRLLGNVGAWAFAPDRRTVAVAAQPVRSPWDSPAMTVRFVDAATLRAHPPAVKTSSSVSEVLWARPDRVVIVACTCNGETTAWRVDAVDIASRRVVSSTPLRNPVHTAVRARGELVLLEAQENRIGATDLDVVDADGHVRSTHLSAVIAGRERPTEFLSDPAKVRSPAVVVDEEGTHAYILQADGPAAAIDLRTLDVSYHELHTPRSLLAGVSAWLTPAADAKAVNGPWRAGIWLGDGLIAVTGEDWSARENADGDFDMAVAAAGLAIVDTHDWTVRMLDPEATRVRVSDGLLLATGSSYGFGNANAAGIGLAAYGADRMLRFRLFGRKSMSLDMLFAGRAYVCCDRNVYAVVDLAKGRVIGRRAGPLPEPLAWDGGW